MAFRQDPRPRRSAVTRRRFVQVAGAASLAGTIGGRGRGRAAVPAGYQVASAGELRVAAPQDN